VPLRGGDVVGDRLPPAGKLSVVSAQMWLPVIASISCAVMRTRSQSNRSGLSAVSLTSSSADLLVQTLDRFSQFLCNRFRILIRLALSMYFLIPLYFLR
jgi:hypothetical protein